VSVANVAGQQPRQVGGIAGAALAQFVLRPAPPDDKRLLIARQRIAGDASDIAAVSAQAQPARPCAPPARRCPSAPSR